MSNDDFSIRLKNIRDKYGCSQPKKNSFIAEAPRHTEAYPLPSRPSSAIKLNTTTENIPERNSSFSRYDPLAEKYERYDKFDKYDKIPAQKRSIIEAISAKQSINREPRLSFGNTSFRAETESVYAPKKYEDYSRNANLQKEIDKIRQAYAADRKKVLASFEEDFEKRNHKGAFEADYLTKNSMAVKPEYVFKQGYSREKLYNRPETHSHKQSYLNSQSERKNKYSHEEEENSSPIKRMIDTPIDNYKYDYSYKKNASENIPSDSTLKKSGNYWRQKEAKLSELTSNRLNELKSIDKEYEYTLKKSQSRSVIKNQPTTLTNQKFGDSPVKPSKYYEGENVSMFSKEYSNKNDYSVSNIDRIQQRIQSILGR